MSKKKLSLEVKFAWAIYAIVGIFVFINDSLIGYFFLLAVLWLVGSFERILYRMGKRPQEIRFSIAKESDSKMLNHVITGLAILLTIWYLSVSRKVDELFICGILASIILFVNGFLHLPKGVLRIKEGELEILDKTNGHEEEIDLKHVTSIGIKENQLLFHSFLIFLNRYRKQYQLR